VLPQKPRAKGVTLTHDRKGVRTAEEATLRGEWAEYLRWLIEDEEDQSKDVENRTSATKEAKNGV
jgi:hypothetical protein